MNIQGQTAEFGRIPFAADRLTLLTERAGVDLILASSRHNIRYLTGGYYYPLYMWDAHTKRTQHLSFLGIPRSSLEDSFFVGRPGEKAVMAEAEVWVEPCFEAKRIGSLSTVERAVEVLRERHLDSGRIAVELSTLPADAFNLLRHGLPDVEFVEAADILDPLRAVKSPQEIELMRDGTEKLLEAVSHALGSGFDGESTLEVADQVKAGCAPRGLHFLYALVCAGPGYFRAPSRKRIWNAGRPLHIDSGGLVGGYVVEVCRMGFLGRPDGLVDELFDGCRQLEEAVLTGMRPGVQAKTLHALADDFLSRYKFGEFGRFIAHGIGMVHHEDPVISPQSGQVLESGMVVSVEMEFLHPDTGHIKIEDMVVVTDEGNEVMSPGGGAWSISLLE